MTVEYDILYSVSEFKRYIVIHGQLAGINARHIHSCLNGVIEDHRVHCFTYRVVSAE